VVLDVAARIPEADFTMVGSGPLADAVASRARSLANVTLKPRMAQASLAEEMRAADLFLLPSSSPTAEGAPQVLAQAAASGLPVVAFRAYQPEAVIDGHTGFLVHDDEELAARIRLLIEQPDLRDRMGRSGVALARDRFDWNEIVRRWEHVLTEAVTRSCAA
jgi:glycosyltransferase involved in cell wall biosynthesis